MSLQSSILNILLCPSLQAYAVLNILESRSLVPTIRYDERALKCGPCRGFHRAEKKLVNLGELKNKIDSDPKEQDKYDLELKD